MPNPVTPKHRSFAGDPENFDFRSAAEFQLLAALGLREFHYVLEIGCGALGTGRLLVPYLLAGRYFGVEREQWLVEEGVRLELGHDQVTMKQPKFLIQSEYRPSEFGVKFDYVMARSTPSTSALKEMATCLRKSGVLITSASDPESLRHAVDEAGLDCKVIDWPHAAEEDWILLYPSGGIAPEDPSPGLQTCTVENLSELQVIQDADCGFVESVVADGQSAVITGWVIHPKTRRPATHALATDNAGRVVARTRAWISRNDVGLAYGKQALRSGFRLRIEKTDVQVARSLVYAGWTAGEEQVFVLRVLSY